MPLYFLTCVLIFWVPGIALLVVNYAWLSGTQRKAFWIVCGIMAVVTFGMEYVYLWADIWSFSEAHDPLLGITFGGAPVEEFTFWFGATPFVLGVYWTAQRRVWKVAGKKAAEGKKAAVRKRRTAKPVRGKGRRG